MTDSPSLRLLPGGLDPQARLGSIRLVAASRSAPPFAVDAVVEEEDTYLVLSADPEVREPREPLMRVLTEVLEARGEAPGSVIVQGGYPLRLLAVVHDLAREPSWRAAWVAEALAEVFRLAARRRLRSLAMPLLGAVHGRLSRHRCLDLIRDAIVRAGGTAFPERLWLVVPEGEAGPVARWLRERRLDEYA